MSFWVITELKDKAFKKGLAKLSALVYKNQTLLKCILQHKQTYMKYLPLNPEIFTQNRKRFIGRMEKNSIAVFNSNDELPTNGDQLFKFKQNSDLFWLTGIEQEDSMLVLFPDNPDPKHREVLILVRPNELK